jgi:hypothetical protein
MMCPYCIAGNKYLRQNLQWQAVCVIKLGLCAQAEGQGQKRLWLRERALIFHLRAPRTPHFVRSEGRI